MPSGKRQVFQRAILLQILYVRIIRIENFYFFNKTLHEQKSFFSFFKFRQKWRRGTCKGNLDWIYERFSETESILEEKCAEFRGELGQIQGQITLAGAEMEQLQEDTKEAREEALKAEKQADKQQKRLKELAPAVKNIERLAADFSADYERVKRPLAPRR